MDSNRPTESRPASPPPERPSDRARVIKLGEMGTQHTAPAPPRSVQTRSAMAQFLNDLLMAIEDSCLQGRDGWAEPRAPAVLAPVQGASARGINHTSSGHVRHSAEWETETLLDHINSSAETGVVSYPCPFRQRNPARFNIRDHEACAKTAFDSLVSLKHHVVACHRRKPALHPCRRCHREFDSESALEEHLLLPKEQMCDVTRSARHDPEDGVPGEVERILEAGVATPEGWSWEWIWRILFPEDPEVPEPEFQPIVELVEVQQAFDEGQDALKSTLREQLGLLLPADLDNDYLNFLAGQLELIFETHRVNVVKQSLSGHWGRADNSHKPNRRSRRSVLLQSLHRTTPPELAAAQKPCPRAGNNNPHRAASPASEPFPSRPRFDLRLSRALDPSGNLKRAPEIPVPAAENNGDSNRRRSNDTTIMKSMPGTHRREADDERVVIATESSYSPPAHGLPNAGTSTITSATPKSGPQHPDSGVNDGGGSGGTTTWPAGAGPDTSSSPGQTPGPNSTSESDSFSSSDPDSSLDLSSASASASGSRSESASKSASHTGSQTPPKPRPNSRTRLASHPAGTGNPDDFDSSSDSNGSESPPLDLLRSRPWRGGTQPAGGTTVSGAGPFSPESFMQRVLRGGRPIGV